MKIYRQKKSAKSVAWVLVFCVISLLFAGCAATQSQSNKMKSMAVESAPDAGFIEHAERQAQRADLPFQKIWINADFDKKSYQGLVIAPVNTKHILEMDWLHQLSGVNLISDVKSDIEELGRYFHDQVIKDFKEDPNHRFQVLSYPAKQPHQATLQLELALIEINPSIPALHAAGWLIIGGGTAAGAINKRTAAFEGRLRDLQTGEVVATFADRDMQDVGPLDLTRLTWYGPVKGIMDRWAQQFVQIANRKPGEMVTDPTAYTLRPF